MDSLLLLTLTIALMFSGGQCYSQSMSCSTVNGKMVCERQSGDGNTAGAFSSAMSGPGGAYQDAAAMTGNSHTGRSQSSRTSVDPFRGFGVPSFYPNRNAGGISGSGHPIGTGATGIPGSGHLIGTGASDATSFNSNTGNTGISTSGFVGTSNNNGIPGPAFGGFAVADSSGNNFYGGGNPYGGGYAHGYGNQPAGFNPSDVFASVGLGGPNLPFNIFGRKR